MWSRRLSTELIDGTAALNFGHAFDLARQYGVSPEQIKAKFNVSSLESMTKVQCSRAIDELSGKAA